MREPDLREDFFPDFAMGFVPTLWPVAYTQISLQRSQAKRVRVKCGISAAICLERLCCYPGNAEAEFVAGPLWPDTYKMKVSVYCYAAPDGRCGSTYLLARFFPDEEDPVRAIAFPIEYYSPPIINDELLIEGLVDDDKPFVLQTFGVCYGLIASR